MVFNLIQTNYYYYLNVDTGIAPHPGFRNLPKHASYRWACPRRKGRNVHVTAMVGGFAHL